MTRYLISFDEGAMDFPESELPAVTEAALAVCRDAEAAGVWVYGDGMRPDAGAVVVGTDGSVVEVADLGATPRIGGFCVLEVATRAEAIEWAGRIAVACRCAQTVREVLPDAP